jgi:hypothetical protein
MATHQQTKKGGGLMAKNPHAAALGRRKSPAKARSSRANGRLGGRPALYRLSPDGLQKLHGERWLTLEPPYDRATQAALRRLR